MTDQTQEQQKDKRAFFAQYWGQDVLIEPDFIPFDEIIPIILMGVDLDTLSDCDFLILRSISQITDEEAIDIQKILRLEDTQAGFETDKEQIKNHLKNGIEGIFLIDFYGYSFEVIDYLRSIGILIPFRGYSVEQIIEMGWAKVRKV